jgi:hypothetical protein
VVGRALQLRGVEGADARAAGTGVRFAVGEGGVGMEGWGWVTLWASGSACGFVEPDLLCALEALYGIAGTCLTKAFL